MKGTLALLPFVLFVACRSTANLLPTPGAQGFDGALTGWRAESTGGRGPDASWDARTDGAAVSIPKVMQLVATNHTSEDRYNVYWAATPRFQDGHLAIAMRADGGAIDQGGGLMWRVQDANNYYVCRFNPLESNYRVYVVKDGVRRQLGTALCEAKAGIWHRLEVEHHGDRITCSANGVKLLEVQDGTIAGAGGVGLWTKADARSSFDDLVVTAK